MKFNSNGLKVVLILLSLMISGMTINVASSQTDFSNALPVSLGANSGLINPGDMITLSTDFTVDGTLYLLFTTSDNLFSGNVTIYDSNDQVLDTVSLNFFYDIQEYTINSTTDALHFVVMSDNDNNPVKYFIVLSETPSEQVYGTAVFDVDAGTYEYDEGSDLATEFRVLTSDPVLPLEFLVIGDFVILDSVLPDVSTAESQFEVASETEGGLGVEELYFVEDILTYLLPTEMHIGSLVVSGIAMVEMLGDFIFQDLFGGVFEVSETETEYRLIVDETRVDDEGDKLRLSIIYRFQKSSNFLMYHESYIRSGPISFGSEIQAKFIDLPPLNPPSDSSKEDDSSFSMLGLISLIGLSVVMKRRKHSL